MFSHAASILISTALVNNFVLAKFLGLCPIMGTSKQVSPAISMSIATALVLTLTAGVTHLVHQYLLAPFQLEAFEIIVDIFVIASLVQSIELMMRHVSPILHRALGIYLPLITTNCAVLGLALLNNRQNHGLLDALLYGFGSALGFAIVLVLFASLRERLAHPNIPACFQGTPIAFITAGLMALAFMGFSGLVEAN